MAFTDVPLTDRLRGFIARKKESFVRFCLVTVLSLVVSFGLTITLHEAFAVAAEIAYALALVTVFVMNFLFMRYYIFRAQQGCIVRQFSLMILASLGFRSAEYGGFLLLHTWAGLHYVAVMFAVQFISFVAKYFFYGGAVFRATSSSSALPPTS